MDITLDTEDGYLKSAPPDNKFLRASTQLQTLVFRRRPHSTLSSELDPLRKDVPQLLRNYACLTHLEIHLFETMNPLLPTDLPNLHTIVGCYKIVACIVPGRPIRSIGILLLTEDFTDPGIQEDEFYLAISQSTAPVTYFKVDLSYCLQFEPISGQFCSLRLLSLIWSISHFMKEAPF